MNPAAPPSTDQRLGLRNRPDRSAAMYQTWRHLLFLHWEADSALLSSKLPSGLHLDLFEGKAYLGLVPFYMRGVRPRGLPAVPGLSNFLELNLRTYVFDEEGNAGVWFYSLDASNRIACAVARSRFHLPYFHAAIHAREDDGTHYEARRHGENESAVFHYRPIGSAREAEPGSFDFFLLERYLLYSHNPKSNRLYCGQVHHEPYRLHETEVGQWSTLPFVWDHLPEPTGDPVHTCYAENVEVEIFSLQGI